MQIVIAIISALFKYFSSSDSDSTAAAGSMGDDGGWLDTLWQGAKGIFGAVGSGLSSTSFSDNDLRQFALEKELGVYASLGIGDDGLIQDGLSGLSKIAKSPVTWVICGFGLLWYLSDRSEERKFQRSLLRGYNS